MAAMDIHHPLALAFGIMGNIVSVLVYFAPAPTFYRIYVEKSTAGFDSFPYAVSLLSAVLWIYYALVKSHSFLLITINSLGCLFQTIYLTFYLVYAPRKARIETLSMVGMMNLGVSALVVGITYFPFRGETRVRVVGWICVAVSIGVFAAPLRIVIEVVTTRSNKFMTFYLSLFLTLSAVMWFGYGILQRDSFIAIPNILGFLLGTIQMILYVIYRQPKEEESETHEEKDKKIPEDSRPISPE